MEKDPDLKILENHVAQLAEHFDTVQIFVTRYIGESKETVNAHYGTGNYFARVGQVGTWVSIQECSNMEHEDEFRENN